MFRLLAYLRAFGRAAIAGTLVVAVLAAVLSVAGCSGADDVGKGDAAQHAVPDSGDMPKGKWEVPRQDPGLSPAQAEEVARLAALGYLAGYNEATSRIGVTRHDPARSFDGLNFYTSGHGPEAFLRDIHGNELHRWRLPIEEVWPHLAGTSLGRGAQYYRRGVLFPNGDVLAIFEGYGLIKLDRDSKLSWSYDGGAHHDLRVLADGRIVTLTRRVHLRRDVNRHSPVIEDYAVILSPEGEELVRVSILDALKNAGPEFQEFIDRIPTTDDLMHTNSVEFLDGRVAKHIPAFAAGNLLISFRRTSTVAVLDLEQEKIVWARHGPWVRQHDPRVLDERTVLIFNNLAGTNESGKTSAVIEYDLVNDEVVWDFQGSVEFPFFSKGCGTARRLPNGNTLIVESNNGRAFEITRDKEVVWEFYSPHRAGEDGKLVANLLDMVRLAPDFPVDWVRRPLETRSTGD